MKKLIMALTPLLLASCQTMKDAGKAVEEQIVNPPSAILEALKTILTFLEGVIGAAVNVIIHGIFPF